MKSNLRCWAYSATKAPKIINVNELERLQASGWADSPAVFMQLDEVGVDQDKIKNGDVTEAAKAQQVLDAVNGVKDSLNGALNLDIMSKNELDDYAKEHFGVDLDRSKKPNLLVKHIRELMEL